MDEGDGQRESGGLQQERDSGLPPGELAPPARLDRNDLGPRVHWAPVSLLCLCVSHTHPLSQTRSHTLFHAAPPASPAFPPSVSWLLLFLPGAGSYTENHSFTLMFTAHPHCDPAHARTHARGHTPQPWGQFPAPPHRILSVPVTTLTCTPAHPHTERASSPCPHPSSYLAAEARATRWMPCPLVTLSPPHLPQSLLPMWGLLVPRLTRV